jgi:hypothetical protein
MFIGFGIIIGAALNTAILFVVGVGEMVIAPAYVAAMVIGLIVCIANRGANPYGDLK